MRVLLDTNVVLDALLHRAPWHVDAEEIIRRSKPRVLDLAITSLTVMNLFYIGRKLVGAARARQDVRTCLSAFEILPVEGQTLFDADALPGMDFEDNVQIAAAVSAHLDYIVTRNPVHFAGSAVRVVTPSQFMALLPP